MATHKLAAIAVAAIILALSAGAAAQDISTDLPEQEGKTTMSPGMLYFLWAYALDPMEGMCFIGDLMAGCEVTEIDPAAIRINDSISVIPEGIVADHPDFNGDALAIRFPMYDFIVSYMPVYDTAEYTYTVTVDCASRGILTVEGSVTIAGLCTGDANGDRSVDVGDAVYIISYIFRNGPAPVLPRAADVNADTYTNVGDAVYLIDYLFNNGPRPRHQ